MDVTRAVTTAVQLSATVSTVPLKATAHIAKGAITVSDVKPRLGVQFVDAKTDTTYVVPAADLSYILMDVAAYVDVRGLCPVVRDITPIIDLSSLLVNKGIIDPVTTSEGVFFEWGRDLSDVVTAEELISVLIIILRTFEDEAFADDLSTIGLGLAKNEIVLSADLFDLFYEKGVADVASLAEVVAKGISKVSQDAQPVEDSKSVSLIKSAQEAVTVSQAFQSVTDFRRVVQEVIAQADLSFSGVDKTVQETISLVEAHSNEFSKVIDDAFTANENAAISMQFNSNASDDAYVSDQSSTLYQKAAFEEVSVADVFSRILDIGLAIPEIVGTVDDLSRAVDYKRDYADTLSFTPMHALLNESTLNTVKLNDAIGGDRVSIYISRPSPPAARSWLYILDDYESYSVLATRSPAFAMNILYGS